MRRILWLKEDLNRRSNFSSNELMRNAFKVLEKEKNITDSVLKFYRKNLIKIPRVYRTRIVRRCVVSGRARWVYRKLGISRMVLKDLHHKGLLYSLTKSSW